MHFCRSSFRSFCASRLAMAYFTLSFSLSGLLAIKRSTLACCKKIACVTSLFCILPIASSVSASPMGDNSSALFVGAFATAECWAKTGRIAGENIMPSTIQLSRSWGVPIEVANDPNVQQLAKKTSPYLQSELGRQCQPANLGPYSVRNAIQSIINRGQTQLDQLQLKIQAATQENECSSAQLERDKAAIVRSYQERNSIEAYYKYRYSGKCVFPPLAPYF